MSEAIEPRQGVWRNRVGFAARLFAVWAAISLIARMVLFPIYMAIVSVVGGLYVFESSDSAGISLLDYGLSGICYFFGGYYAARFFREPWLKVGLGIPLMSFVIIIWRQIWQAILGPVDHAGFFENFGVLWLMNFLWPFVIALGVLYHHSLKSGQIRALIHHLRRWPDV